MNDFLCFCPFHGNNYTPSFSVSKTSGEFICFNGSCAETGGLLELVKSVKHKNDFEAMRIISKAKTDTVVDFKDTLQKALAPTVAYEEFSQDKIDLMKKNFWENPSAVAYMHGRGFDDLTLVEFEVGYSALKGLTAVPMHTQDGLPIGVIGRSPSDEDKVFKNSKGLRTSQSLFNIHRAKRLSDTVIICESSFDVMRLTQAGYGNAVACLMGHFSVHHQDQLERYFSTIVIATDFDDKTKHQSSNCKRCGTVIKAECSGHNPGRDLGEDIASRVQGKVVKWASFDYQVVYPHGAKDMGDMTDPEIRQCIKNAVSNYEYHTWPLAA